MSYSWKSFLEKLLLLKDHWNRQKKHVHTLTWGCQCHHQCPSYINLNVAQCALIHRNAAKSAGLWIQRLSYGAQKLWKSSIWLGIYEINVLENSDIFEAGGNVVDATIATMLCSGITTAQSMGIGGGFLMNIWFQDKKKSVTLNAKEVAPLAATKDMFKTTEEYSDGPLTIAVPGEVKGIVCDSNSVLSRIHHYLSACLCRWLNFHFAKGYWELHKKYGSMPWKSLVEPSIKVCENGFKLTQHMSDYIVSRLTKAGPLRYVYFVRAFYLFSKFIYSLLVYQFRNSFFINGTNNPHQPGDSIVMPSELCNTYKMLSANGGDDFYTGALADLIAEDLKDLGSIVTKEDLQSYE